MNLGSIPSTEQEIKILENFFSSKKSKTFLGAAATKQDLFKQDLETFDLISFATHGILPNEKIGLQRSGLVLTSPKNSKNPHDAILTTSEIAQLNLNAQLVILSACNTAIDENTLEGGFSNMVKAFLFAGANAVLASNWYIDSDATTQISTSFVSNILEYPDKDLAISFQESIVTMLTEHRKDHWAHPAFWGPFSLTGSGS